MTWIDPSEDDREMMDIPTDQPLGSLPIKINVPIPTVEQVAGEIARQVMASEGYSDRPMLRRKAADALDNMIDKIIAEKATPIIEELLAKPLQPTDGFGNPTGEPTSLHAVLAHHITQWSATPVDREGRPGKVDHYNKPVLRLEWMLGQVVNAELTKQINTEVARITAQLKAGATNAIAKQIAEKISGMILK